MFEVLPCSDTISSDCVVGACRVSLKPHGLEAPHTSSNAVNDWTPPCSRANLGDSGSGASDWTPQTVLSVHDMVPRQNLSNPQNQPFMPKQRLQMPQRQPVQQKKYPCSDPVLQTKQPLILYCGVNACTSDPQRQAAHKSLHFPGHVHFARWLFAQRRGAVTPWAILVASWREAKPCAMAIAAARTGCCDGLRLDERRPQLRKCSGILDSFDSGQLANVAVSGMIVILADGECAPKAAKWVHRAASMTKLPFHAVCDNGVDLGNIISSVAQGFFESHKGEHEQQLIQVEDHPAKPTDPAESR